MDRIEKVKELLKNRHLDTKELRGDVAREICQLFEQPPLPTDEQVTSFIRQEREDSGELEPNPNETTGEAYFRGRKDGIIIGQHQTNAKLLKPDNEVARIMNEYGTGVATGANKPQVICSGCGRLERECKCDE